MDDRAKVPFGHERRFLGVDPGLTRTGLGLIVVSHGRLVYADSQIIEPAPNHSLRDRLYHLYTSVQKFLRQWHPEVMVVENLIYARNAQVALKLGHARGVLLVTAAKHDLPVVEYAPRDVKMAVTGYGAASKEQMQRMVQAVLNMSHPPETYDVADALALAICHAHRCGSKAFAGSFLQNGSSGHKTNRKTRKPRLRSYEEQSIAVTP